MNRQVSAFIRDLGLFLHLPAVLTILVVPVAVYFKEWSELSGFMIMAGCSFLVGQSLIILPKHEHNVTRGSVRVLLAGVWLLVPIIGLIPYYWIANHLNPGGGSAFESFHSSFFESMSGFTGTGLTMIERPDLLPHTLQFWRSLSEWCGGLGMIFFAVALFDTSFNTSNLYAGEQMNWTARGHSQTFTIRKIWIIYIALTIVSVIAFVATGMSWWESINHGLTGISTGGFTMSGDSFVSYDFPVKIAAIIIMIIGALSFQYHFILFYRVRPTQLIKEKEFVLYVALLLLSITIFMILAKDLENVDAVFQVASALGTCGFNSVDVGAIPINSILLLLIVMFLGGNSNSTAGGIKTRRLINVFGFLSTKTANIHDLSGTETNKEFKEASRIILLFISTIAASVALALFIEPQANLAKVAFDVTSAVSNVGLSTGFITADSPTSIKYIFIAAMWAGRLEIMAILLLINSVFRKRHLIQREQPFE